MPGQIIPRGQQKWLVRIFLGRDPITKKRRYLNKTVPGTKKDAQRWLTQTQRDLDTYTFVEPSRRTVAEYLVQWLDTSAKPRLKESTFRSYKKLMERYVIPAFGNQQLLQLSPLEIQSLYTRMGTYLSASTIRYTHVIFQAALNQAVKWRFIPFNPAALTNLPRQKRCESKVLTEEQSARFIKVSTTDKWHALWALLITTGIRPGEAMGLKWTDVDLEKKRLQIQRTLARNTGSGWTLEEPKTSRSRRTVHFPGIVVQALQSHKARQNEEILAAGQNYKRNDFVFAGCTGEPLHIRNLSRRHFFPLLKKANLPLIRLYDLRHTCATLLLGANIHPKIVSELLGHSSIATTLNTYSHVLPTMQASAAEKLDKILSACE